MGIRKSAGIFGAYIKTPKSQDNKTVLLSYELNIRSADEKLKIDLMADIIFELNQIPENYDKLEEEILISMANESLLNTLDTILIAMGQRKMNLAQKMKNITK